ncbi:MAG: CBS domain-containing protein [Polyangiaceae bacterium]|nr:CBS domain-containing protein [Polyangiaceae bacterium]
MKQYRSASLTHIDPSMPTEEILRILQERHFSTLPVMRDGKLLGIVSITDLAKLGCMTLAGFPHQKTQVPSRSAADVMSSPVVTIDEEEPIQKAAQRMLDHKIHRVVATRAGAPVGILSTRDLMAAVRDHRVETKLREVTTYDVETIDMDASIVDAIATLALANVHGLVVVDGGWPVGVFTRLETIYAQSLPAQLREQAVERIMSYETICFDENTPIYRVAGHAVSMGARRVLVVRDRELVGIASGFDLARVVAGIA